MTGVVIELYKMHSEYQVGIGIINVSQRSRKGNLPDPAGLRKRGLRAWREEAEREQAGGWLQMPMAAAGSFKFLSCTDVTQIQHEYNSHTFQVLLGAIVRYCYIPTTKEATYFPKSPTQFRDHRRKGLCWKRHSSISAHTIKCQIRESFEELTL